MAFSNSKYPGFKPIYAWIIAGVFTLSACGLKKTLRPDQYLLKKNAVTLEPVKLREILADTGAWTVEKVQKARSVKKRSKVTHAELTAQILHRANKRVVFGKLPIYMWLYNLGTKRHDPATSDSVKIRRKLRNNWGEPPVALDSNLVHLSADNIRNYLFNSGFFEAKVTYKITIKKRKAFVHYDVIPGRAYLINSVFVRTADSSMYPVVKKLVDGSDFFRLWWPMNMNRLNDSRTYLSKQMRDMGYYTIIPESFRFEADTIQALKHVQLTAILDNPPNGGKHEIYTFGNVRVNFETSKAYEERTLNPRYQRYPGLFLQLNRYPVNPTLIRKLIYIDSGGKYNQADIEKTYQSLVQMGLFSVVDMRFYTDTTHHVVYTLIDVKTVTRISVSVEPQGLYSPQGTSGTNFISQSQRSFGLAGILAFTNRNMAKNSENLRLSSVTSYEAIFKKDNKNNLGYSLQQGLNASLTLPHFRLFKNNQWGNFSQRNTLLSLSYQYENNPNFFRSSIPASITLQYVKPKLSWYYTPTEVSFNRNILSQGFIDQLSATDSAFIRRVFTNQFVTAAKLGLIYANNRTKPGETYIFVRTGFEASGNLHRFIRKMSDPDFHKDTVYQLFGLQYFQYSKIEGEVRLRRSIDELNSVALRVHSGVALPYGNSAVVPYDKRYFIGGSNSLRAWRPRRLGPGSTSDTLNQIIDRSGEFLFEANIEYRFSVIRQFLEMALFLDAGNIWNLKRKNQTASSASILLKENFMDEVAINSGLGFRFDFKIFLFRIDWGVPLHDPGKPLQSRWLLNKKNIISPWEFTKRETALAIGIGYPF